MRQAKHWPEKTTVWPEKTKWPEVGFSLSNAVDLGRFPGGKATLASKSRNNFALGPKLTLQAKKKVGRAMLRTVSA